MLHAAPPTPFMNIEANVFQWTNVVCINVVLLVKYNYYTCTFPHYSEACKATTYHMCMGPKKVGGLCMKVQINSKLTFGTQPSGLYREVVYGYRWSLRQVSLYDSAVLSLSPFNSTACSCYLQEVWL